MLGSMSSCSFELWLACLALGMSSSGLSSKVYRKRFGGFGPFQSPFSSFGSRAWRWSSPLHVCLYFEGLTRVLCAGHLLFKLVFKRVPKVIWHTGVSSKLHFRFSARVPGAGQLLFKVVFKSTPKLIWRAWVTSNLRFRGSACALGAGHLVFTFVFKSVPKLIWRAWAPSRLHC